MTDRLDLNVPFADKDSAKAAGARWDALNRVWYFPGSAVPPALSKWEIPGSRPDSAICQDIAVAIGNIVGGLDNAYDRAVAVAEIRVMVAEITKGDKISRRIYAFVVAAGKQRAVDLAKAWICESVYGEAIRLPQSGVASLDEFLMYFVPKRRRPADALDWISKMTPERAIRQGGIKTLVIEGWDRVQQEEKRDQDHQ